MIWLLIKKANGYDIESPDTYGMSTWGTNSQDSIEKKTKNWYYHSWSSGGRYYDDEVSEEKINVVLETTDFEEVVKYLVKKKVNIKPLLKKAKEEMNKYFDFYYYECYR